MITDVYLLYLWYLFHLWIQILLINAIINWYDTDEDLNDAADLGEIMEGGGGEVLNEAGTL